MMTKCITHTLTFFHVTATAVTGGIKLEVSKQSCKREPKSNQRIQSSMFISASGRGPSQLILVRQVVLTGIFAMNEDLSALTVIFIMSLPMTKINNLGFRPVPTQTRLYSHRSRLEP